MRSWKTATTWVLAGVFVQPVLHAQAETYEIESIFDYLVTAPNGNRLATKVIQPRADRYPGEAFPAVVSISGGLGAGESESLNVAELGFVEFHFNAEGRGASKPSDGVEDHNGLVHQDDLKAVIEFALSRENVMVDNLGVASFSYGITMAAGCLARYPDLPVKYLIDVEGPSDSYVIGLEPWALDADPSNDRHEWALGLFGHYSMERDPSPENVEFWSERQASVFISSIRCRYVRMQAVWDHIQPPNQQWPAWDYGPTWYAGKFAVDLINLATEGDASWTRLNGATLGNLPNKTYDYENRPVLYSGFFNGHAGELERTIVEMAEMPLSFSDCNDNGIPDDSELEEHDCNENGVPDDCDLQDGTSADLDLNGVPDECDPDCNENGFPDGHDVQSGISQDCDGNGVPDECDIAAGDAYDCNANDQLDECEASPFPEALAGNTTGLAESSFLGPPDDVYEGLGGKIVTYDFGAARLANGAGGDFNVYEGPSEGVLGGIEFASIDVLVSVDGETFVSVKTSEAAVARRIGDEALANDRLARSYDIESSGVAEARYVRIQGLGDEAAGEGRGFDLDAIGAVYLRLCSSPMSFRRGDSNADGEVDVSDAVYTLEWLFAGGAALVCQDAADTNDDGGLDISDPVNALGWLFGGGDVPPAPGPAGCGVDPTPDALAECAYPQNVCDP